MGRLGDDHHQNDGAKAGRFEDAATPLVVGIDGGVKGAGVDGGNRAGQDASDGVVVEPVGASIAVPVPITRVACHAHHPSYVRS